MILFLLLLQFVCVQECQSALAKNGNRRGETTHAPVCRLTKTGITEEHKK